MNNENKITPQSPIIKQSEAFKIVDDLFKQQEQQMQSMLFNRHKFDCEIFSCKADPCLIWEPDRIVATTTACGICKEDIIGDWCTQVSCKSIIKEFESGTRKSISKKVIITDNIENKNTWEQQKNRVMKSTKISGKSLWSKLKNIF